jgi:hypothetical protein
MRSMKGHALPNLKITQQVGEEPALHAIHAHVESIAVGRRSDRIRARLLLAGRVDSQERNKLSGLKIELFQLRDGKFKMETRCGF